MGNLPISLEARAEMIADEVNKTEHAGNTAKRREAVKRVALEQLRIVHARQQQQGFYSANNKGPGRVEGLGLHRFSAARRVSAGRD